MNNVEVCIVRHSQFQTRTNCIFRTFRVEESFWTKKQSCNLSKICTKKWRLFFWFCLFQWTPFYLAWVYGKGHAFPEILVPNSLPLHTIVLKNRFYFSGTFHKGNVPHLTHCEPHCKYFVCVKYTDICLRNKSAHGFFVNFTDICL